MTTKIRRSSGNVFRDLGFSAEESRHLKIRSDLMIRLTKLIDTRGLTQAQAAELLGVTQPRISDLVRGKIDRFSIDTLIAMLGHAGVRVQIVLGRSSKTAAQKPSALSPTATTGARRPRRFRSRNAVAQLSVVSR